MEASWPEFNQLGNDIVDIDIKDMVELGMIGMIFLDFAVVFDTPF